MTEYVEIFTDGACRGNPGPGGWGALLRYKDSERELKGSDPDTTITEWNCKRLYHLWQAYRDRVE